MAQESVGLHAQNKTHVLSVQWNCCQLALPSDPVDSTLASPVLLQSESSNQKNFIWLGSIHSSWLKRLALEQKVADWSPSWQTFENRCSRFRSKRLSSSTEGKLHDRRRNLALSLIWHARTPNVLFAKLNK